MPDTQDQVFHILYVDDEETLLDITKQYLERLGNILVDTASSAKEGLSCIQQKQYEAIVSDYEMPEMNGIEFLSTVRSQGIDLPFIIFTGRGREEIVIKALDAGADFYLQKGGTPKAQFTELKHKIIQAIHKRRLNKKVLIFNHLYAILGAVNATSVRLRDRDALLMEICRIAINEGLFSGAWIGLLEQEGSLLCPVAWSGFVDQVPGTIPVRELYPDPLFEIARKAVTLNHYQISQIPQKPIPHSSDADKDTHDSPQISQFTLAFPLYINNHPAGVIQLYTGEPTIFLQDILLLIDKIVSDISFALETIQAEQERDAARSALEKSELQYRAIFENAVEGIFQSTPDGHFLALNPSFARIFGYDAPEDMIAEVTNISHQIYSSPQDRIKFLQMLKTNKKVSGFEVKCKAKTGSDVWISIHAQAITDSEGKISFFDGTIEDITARKEAEIELLQRKEEIEASYGELAATKDELSKNYRELATYQQELLEQKHLFSGIIEFLPDATFAIDIKGTVIIWNRAIEEMTGVIASDIIGCGNYEYAIPFYQKRRPGLLELVLHESVRESLTYAHIEKQGEKLISETFVAGLNKGKESYLWFTASPLYNAHGEIIGAIESIRDITDKKKAEEELLRKNEEITAAYEEITATEEELRQNYQELATYEQELIEQKHLFSDLIEFLPDATFAIDIKGTVIIWNRAVEELTGIRADEILTKGDYEYGLLGYGTRRPILIDCILDETLLTGMPYDKLERDGRVLQAEGFIPELRGGKGVYLWFTASPLYNAQGDIIGAIESMRDITDKKKAEEELLRKNEEITAAYEEITATEEELRRNYQELANYEQELLEQKHLFSNLIEFLPDATFAIDMKGTVIIWNRAMEEMTGTKAIDILFKGDYEYATPFYQTRRPVLIDCVLDKTLLSRVAYPVLRHNMDGLTAEIFIPHMKDGKGAYLWFTASPLYNTQKEIIGAIESIRDITSFKQTDS